MHVNAVPCPGCEAKMEGISNPFLLAFYKSFREANKDAHVSCGWRNKADQEADFKRGVSRAHFGQSAHNFGLALDWFRLTPNGANFDAPWFRNVLGPAVNSTDGLIWGGTFKSIIDLPHVEVDGWRALVATCAPEES